MKLSVCIIAKNEEKSIRACLESVRGVAWEIIFVDTGSTDDTIKIAKEFSCKIIFDEWADDFSHSRNVSLRNARGNFILVIDADEILQNPDELKNVIRIAPENTGGWLVTVESQSKYASFRHKLLRLFRNEPSYRFEGIIHEQIMPAILKSGKKVADTNILLSHSGYNLGIENFRKKQERNLDLLSKAISLNPGKSFNFFNRAKTNMALEKFDDAVMDIESALQISSEDSPMFVNYLNYAAILNYKAGNHDKAIYFADTSLNLLRNQTLPNFVIAEINFEKKNFKKALKFYSEIENQKGRQDLNSLILGEFVIRPADLYLKKGKCFFEQKEYAEASLEFKKGIAHDEKNLNCLLGYANSEFLLKNYYFAYEALAKAARIAPKNHKIKNFLAQTKALLPKADRESTLFHLDKKPLISLSMIVKNEEEFLRGCLESVKDIADEMVIIDTGSTDRTLEIAKSFEAKTGYFKWVNDFSVARNESLKKCTGEWILYLDADERLVAPGRFELEELLKNTPEDVGAYNCIVESPHARQDGGSELHYATYPRLFRNYGHPAIQFRGKVHEQISKSIVELGKRIEDSKIHIKHLGYDRSPDVIKQKIKRNYDMLMEQVKENPTHGYTWFQLGQTLGMMKLTGEAIKALEFAVNCGDLSDKVFASATSTLAQLYGNSKEYQKAFEWAEKSLGKAPGNSHAKLVRAYSMIFLGKAAEARAELLELKNKSRKEPQLPSAGFEIALDDSVIDKGLALAREALGL
jgi:glycosyltransferase involved in cell wall biosynthesis